MLRPGIAACVFAVWALADGFTFTIGSPVASQDFLMKMAAFVFRTEGCAEPAKAQIAATAEGLVKGARRSMALTVVPSKTKAGVYAVPQVWPAEGAWVVNLKGACAEAHAGAVIPFGPKGFIREATKFFPRPATDAEIETALKALNTGGNQ